MHGRNVAESAVPASQPDGEPLQVLEPTDFGPELYGADAEECEGLRPTRYELKEIGRFWYRKYLEGWYMLFTDEAGRTETLRWAHAQQRVRQIVSILGDTGMREVFESVEQGEGKRVGDRYRLMFPNGRDEDWKALVRLSCLLNQRLDAQPEKKHSNAEEKRSAGNAGRGNARNRSDRFQDSIDLGFERIPGGEAGCRFVTIGYVPEVNGAEAEERDEFKPTRHELKAIARLWYKTYLDDKLFWFFTGQAGCTEMRRTVYAMRRINRIESVIGENAVKAVFDSIEEEERKRIGDKYWHIFQNGSGEEWAEVQEETHQKLAAQSKEKHSGAEDDCSTDAPTGQPAERR